jgi:hypothetical protein
MVMNWKTSTFYWTGVASLVPQTYLVFTSWGVFRNPQYELFKKWEQLMIRSCELLKSSTDCISLLPPSSWPHYSYMSASD